MQNLNCFALILVFLDLVHGQCYQSTYLRGWGYPISTCNDDEEQNGLLCYPRCREGYFGNGPICYENCRSGYTNIGLLCFRPSNIYWKSCCCVTFYFYSTCCGNCDSGYSDLGCMCGTPPDSYPSAIYGRGAGTPLKCKSYEEMSGILCYPKCKAGYDGVGPLCWLSGCNGAYTYSCKMHTICAEIGALGSAVVSPFLALPLMGLCESRGLMCTKDSSQCDSMNTDIATDSIGTAIGIATVVATAGSFVCQ